MTEVGLFDSAPLLLSTKRFLQISGNCLFSLISLQITDTGRVAEHVGTTNIPLAIVCSTIYDTQQTIHILRPLTLFFMSIYKYEVSGQFDTIYESEVCVRQELVLFSHD